MSPRTTRRGVLRRTGITGAIGLSIAGCLGQEEQDDGSDGDDGDDGDDGSDGSDGTDGGAGSDDPSDEPEGTVRIGVLQPMTGDLEYYGTQSLWGFLSGLAYKYDAAPAAVETAGQETIEGENVTYELYVEDTQFSGDQAQSLATQLVQDRDVDLLFGTSSSGAAEQVVRNVVEPAGVPMVIGPAAGANLTSDGETCNELVFRASENTAMDARSGGRYVAQETDVEAVYIMAADYTFGYAVADNYERVLEEEGVDVVGTDFVPQEYSEFEGHFENAVDAGADAVIGGFTVATLPQFLSTGLAGGYGLRMFGGFATQITNAAIGEVAGNVLGEPLTAEALEEAQLGPFTTRYHWNQYDNAINDWFVENYTDVYGVVPDLFTSGTFVAASSIVQAVRESGSTDGAEIAATMRGMTVTDTPKGEGGYEYQEYNNQARSAMTIANPVPTDDEWADDWDSAVMPSEPLATIGMDETTIPADDPEMNCDL
ncbi:ABC transporter substrate-binding protein [Salinilacihabitans rarus]|uniref:ABC transporter substrate-binding protein n=1 Tax=Salinilacihabitans rarus TaxID=2961596 RepID=UPI0020C89CF4|nr:ABC transporter substrate-binding protein [Salinilacihabitans rarus]